MKGSVSLSVFAAAASPLLPIVLFAIYVVMLCSGRVGGCEEELWEFYSVSMGPSTRTSHVTLIKEALYSLHRLVSLSARLA